MKTPAPAPTEEKREIPAIPFSPGYGDRAETRFPFAVARAQSRALSRGRQQVRRQRLRDGSLTPYWLIQDVR